MNSELGLTISKINLFLDDVRVPADVTTIHLPDIEWVVVRTQDEFKSHILREGMPAVLSLDYNLADNKTSYHSVIWLKQLCSHYNIDIPPIFIHSSNPLGVALLTNVLHA